MKVISLDGPLLYYLDKMCSAMIINVMFILFSLPVVTVGASATAMCRCLLTMSNDSDNGIIRLFWDSFKSNFRKATLLELCVLPVLAIAIWEVVTLLSGVVGAEGVTAILFILPLLLVTGVISYIFSLQAQFENKVLRTIKNAALLAVRHLFSTIAVTALNLVFPVIAFLFPSFLMKTMLLWLIIGFTLIAAINTRILKKVFVRYFPKEEETGTEQPD